MAQSDWCVKLGRVYYDVRISSRLIKLEAVIMTKTASQFSWRLVFKTGREQSVEWSCTIDKIHSVEVMFNILSIIITE